MSARRFALLFVSPLLFVATSYGQVSYRGVIKKKDSATARKAQTPPPKPVAKQPAIPKWKERSKKLAEEKQLKEAAEREKREKTLAQQKAEREKRSKEREKKAKEATAATTPISRRITHFPRVLTADIRVDFVGFYTNLKKYVPATVVFRLIRTNRTGVKKKEYSARVVKVQKSTKVTSKISIVTPRDMPPGFYDIEVLDAEKRSVSISKNELVAGISMLKQSYFANVLNGQTGVFPLLIITGYGFGPANKGNFAFLDKSRLGTVIAWNDSVIKLIVPYWINTGREYFVYVKNFRGEEYPSRSASPAGKLRFLYKGIRGNFFNADISREDLARIKSDWKVPEDPLLNVATTKLNDNSRKRRPKGAVLAASTKQNRGSAHKSEDNLGITTSADKNRYLTILQIRGLGFGEQRKDSKVYLNSTECRSIISWSDTVITVNTTAIPPGRYVSKVFLNPNNRWQKNVYSARDSFFVSSRVPYKRTRIAGASYMVSLKRSELPSETFGRNTSYIYTLPRPARVELAFYDADGKYVYAKLFSDDKVQPKGRYKITYNSSDLSAGKYLLVLTVNKDKYMKIFHPVVVR